MTVQSQRERPEPAKRVFGRRRAARIRGGPPEGQPTRTGRRPAGGEAL